MNYKLFISNFGIPSIQQTRLWIPNFYIRTRRGSVKFKVQPSGNQRFMQSRKRIHFFLYLFSNGSFGTHVIYIGFWNILMKSHFIIDEL